MKKLIDSRRISNMTILEGEIRISSLKSEASKTYWARISMCLSTRMSRSGLWIFYMLIRAQWFTGKLLMVFRWTSLYENLQSNPLKCVVQSYWLSPMFAYKFKCLSQYTIVSAFVSLGSFSPQETLEQLDCRYISRAIESFRSLWKADSASYK